MAQTKKMNLSFFVEIQKDLTASGELIRARQDEKQALMNEFDKECKRFFFGKISERALASSVKKTNLELKRLDKSIRDTMSRARNISMREMVLVSAQSPISYKATLSGIVGGKKKKAVKRKVVRKKKVVKKAKKRVVKKSVKRKVSKRKAARKKKK
ncbi:MAG: hypothetical protein V1788_02015 [Nanoarchaeota archaeon]